MWGLYSRPVVVSVPLHTKRKKENKKLDKIKKSKDIPVTGRGGL
jgi:hypothetical protein